MTRSTLANKKFHAMISELARRLPLAPWNGDVAREAFKRYSIAIYVREARMEAYGAGDPDPFPVRPVQSRSLSGWQMADMIECTLAHFALAGVVWDETNQLGEEE